MAERGERVALVLADQWMPEITGADLLARVKELHPQTKRALLIAWGDWADEPTAAAVRDAVARGCVEYYVLKPWKSPDELFHRSVTEYLHEWSPCRRGDAARGDARRAATVRRAHELRDLLTHNRVPHRFVDGGQRRGRLAARAGGASARGRSGRRPEHGKVLVDPTDRDVAGRVRRDDEARRAPTSSTSRSSARDRAGWRRRCTRHPKGCDALVIERRAIGGQAGSSSMIRNYLGFSRGVAGNDLTQRAYQQAWIFGTQFLQHQEVTCVRCGDDDARHRPRRRRARSEPAR